MDTVLNMVFSVTAYIAVVAGVLKLFQIHTELGEIKDLLRDFKRNTNDPASPSISTQESPESLMRAVSAASYPEPSSIEPER
jgi:hypothetical protein